jgi:hypothetical protein
LSAPCSLCSVACDTWSTANGKKFTGTSSMTLYPTSANTFSVKVIGACRLPPTAHPPATPATPANHHFHLQASGNGFTASGSAISFGPGVGAYVLTGHISQTYNGTKVKGTVSVTDSTTTADGAGDKAYYATEVIATSLPTESVSVTLSQATSFDETAYANLLRGLGVTLRSAPAKSAADHPFFLAPFMRVPFGAA